MNMNKTECKPEIVHYWMITFTLTSGEEIKFYVKALTKSDALRIANDYRFIADNDKMLLSHKNKFMLKY